MTHFRFRYKRVGYIRWRRRAARRRTLLVVTPLAAVEPGASSASAWRRSPLAEAAPKAPAAPVQRVLQVGEFVVSEEGDPQLTGHPDIRY
ncbi:MAG TPA: hypothetical protein VF630_20480 [Hymenobacter sp.]